MTIEAAMARNGYSTSLKSTGGPRSIEYAAFAQITRDLSATDRTAPDYTARITEALHKNLRLWAILADDVANDNNQLPGELRSKLFYLAEFTRHHTAKVYAGDGDAEVLIEINTAIMKGLKRTQPAEGSEECPAGSS